MKTLEHYNLLKALRPFSLVVAVIACGLGILIAWNEGHHNGWIAMLIMLGGILAQSGINLINDIEDLALIPEEHQEQHVVKQMIHRNVKVGIWCFVLASLIACFLVYLQGWQLFVLILISGILALSYNIGPINFKQRGLAIIQVFLLMGIMMVQGAYLAMTGHFSYAVFLHSIPVSLLVSLLLLSNELRDWDTDKRDNLKTLTVRIGYANGVRLYWGLILLAYLLAGLYFMKGEILHLYWLLIPLPLLIPISRYLRAEKRAQLTPLTGRFFFLFGISYMLTLGISQKEISPISIL